MKYFIYCILALFGCSFFLPEEGSTKIRNIPLLVTILLFIILYCIFNLARLMLFIHKVKTKLKKSGFEIRKTGFRFRQGYIIAEDDTQVYCINLLVRKRSYYRYHFRDVENIEFFKSSFSVSLASRRGTVARGATYSRMVGKQKIQDCSFDTNKNISHFLVINKFPQTITDSTRKQELGNGDCICSSNVELFNLSGFEIKNDE